MMLVLHDIMTGSKTFNYIGTVSAKEWSTAPDTKILTQMAVNYNTENG